MIIVTIEIHWSVNGHPLICPWRSTVSNPYEKLWIYYLEGIPSTLPDPKAITTFIGNWEEDGFSFLFFSAPYDELIDKMVSEDHGITLIDRYEMTGEEWHGDKIESYTTGSLCISPPWKIPFINRPGIHHILLDPGVVFGTGRHQTTEDCLGYMEYLFTRAKEENAPIKTALDIGTGTGILALGAAALGCNKVLALDFNLLAVRTAHHNVKLNGMADRILTLQARGEDLIVTPADLVIANIHYDVMKELIEVPEFLTHQWLILSGLLNSEARTVVSRLQEKQVEIIEHIVPDGVWNTILARTSH